MGFTTRPGTSIRDFQPDDTDDTMYIDTDNRASPRMSELVELIKKKWPEAEIDEIAFESKHIHTHCLGYDRYDSSDYTNFLVMSYHPRPKEKIAD